jgi:hypothetical protein
MKVPTISFSDPKVIGEISTMNQFDGILHPWEKMFQ